MGVGVPGNPAWIMCLTYHLKDLDHWALRSIAALEQRPRGYRVSWFIAIFFFLCLDMHGISDY